MQYFDVLTHWQTHRKSSFFEDRTLGCVLTMGNLHRGHASLIERSLSENDCTVVSIFVNPTQFNNPIDYQNYPKTLEADLKLLREMGVELCVCFKEKALYPNHFAYRVRNLASDEMEGRFRPGHFEGMLTIVLKLLLLIRPHRAYFGEKDYQQLQLIKGLTQAFFIDCEIIACPTIREASQLPYSSRNHRLSPEERALADKFAAIFHGSQTCYEIQKALEAQGIRVEYIEDHGDRRFIAVHVGNVRLIDNYQQGLIGGN